MELWIRSSSKKSSVPSELDIGGATVPECSWKVIHAEWEITLVAVCKLSGKSHCFTLSVNNVGASADNFTRFTY